MGCLILLTAVPGPTWHQCWKDTRSTPTLRHPPLCLKITQNTCKELSEEDHRLWTWSQVQESLRLPPSLAPLPLVQLVERRSHRFQCFLNLDKQTNGPEKFSVCFLLSPSILKGPSRTFSVGMDVVLWRINVCQDCQESLRWCGSHG